MKTPSDLRRAAPAHVLVVSRDASVRALARQALSGAEFATVACDTLAEASAHAREQRPDVVLSGILAAEADGAFAPLRTLPGLAAVPWLVLCFGAASEGLVDVLDDAADDYLADPDGTELRAKVLGVLRLLRRVREARPASSVTSGRLGPGGVMPLLKLCETQRFSGWLTVRRDGRELRLEMLGGEILQGDGTDALDALASFTGGSYHLEQRPLDSALLEAAERPPAAVWPAQAESGEGAPPMMPAGRLSRVEVAGALLDVQTEARNDPDFAITTVVAKQGRIVRSIQRRWPHPLQRRADAARARAEVDDQHASVVRRIDRIVDQAEDAPRPSAPGAEGADPALLLWAAYFVVEQVVPQLGPPLTASCLRRSATEAETRLFRVEDDARVELAPSAPSALPPGATGILAAWLLRFLDEAARLGSGGVDVRQATTLMQGALDRAGFYDAFRPHGAPAPGGRGEGAGRGAD